ncbi:MAG: pre-peptidase C-terminal domain-containing protein [Brevundimonas sp.]|uniref:pre-peptidase C-terminal domain-containing protein n=1 Tax=Brevundimonas sp. TaxID=1871086 RepID=UPI001842DC3B|nr:pre-peptidase C-terminal domain-containing protein [Brevundimonas sp.]MBA4803101.1 pre-peptidase C-terminal domain-containing protein [Brevundimonas sp.]
MSRSFLVATTALGLLAGPAFGQAARTASDTPVAGSRAAPADGARQLRPGVTVSGQLRRGDETLSSGEYNDRWTFPVRRGQTWEVTLGSSDFDAYLLVRGPGGLEEDNDDDPAARGSRDSRIRFTAPADGEVEVGATSYQPGETGSYRLTLAAAGGATRAPERASGAVSPGQTRAGELAGGDAQLDSGEYVDSWTLAGRRGDQLDIRLTSTAFDPYVAITGPDGFSEFNDDDPEAGGSRDSRLRVTLPADGDYTIAATSYEPGESGAYRLAVLEDRRGSQPLPGPADERSGGRLMTVGERVEGVLAAGDETLDSGEYVDTYRFAGRRGERVAVELTSSAFDAYTILRTPSGEQFDNDDGEDGTDSRQQMVLPEDGEYEVRVTSFRPGETGSYRFSVESGREPPRQAAVPGGARVFAVMVGVSDYEGEVNDLPFTDEDARKLAEDLRRGGALNDASLVLTNAEATVAGVRAAFRRVAAEAGPDDMFLFFFSGHGDQQPAEVSGLEPDGKSETLSLVDGELTDVELAELFDGVGTRLSLLVVDACFSGGFARNVVDRPGVMGVFSSEEDLTSAVADKFQAGGYLSHFVRAGMTGEADGDGDRLVTAGELATYLRRQFRVEVEDVQAETGDGQRNYQNLVIDRGGVQVDDVIVRLPATGSAAGL